MPSVSVVIPVKNAGPLFGQVLRAVQAQGELELIVIDSGSSDGSVETARAAGAQVLEIRPEEFGHGRTRNLGVERASGDLICFLTQDAVPEPGWLDAYLEAFTLDDRVGAAYGPHLPLPGTSPMIARELTEFFAGFSPNGSPALQRRGDPTFLSNVNACYARACWEEIRFEDIGYAEDQAFGRAMLERGWTKVFHPGAAVLHAHDYGPVEFPRRYFDEFRGLRETIGHTHQLSARSVLGTARRQLAGDRRWMAERGYGRLERLRWSARSAVHHATRELFAGLGSRAHRMPAHLQRLISLEGRASTGRPAQPAADEFLPRGRDVAPVRPAPAWGSVLELSRQGPAPLLASVPGMADRERLHIAVVIPPFTPGSGGHSSIFQLVLWLERMGHTCSIWVHDAPGRHEHERAAVIRRRIIEEFSPVRAPVFKEFDAWYGADVVVATSWETTFPVMMLEGCRARAYLIHDHEPDFFATSAESTWAEQTYGFDLFPISASNWLADVVRERYGRAGAWFRFGVDHGVYRPRPIARRPDTVIFYGRDVTSRRAVPLGMLALHELWRRRAGRLHVVLFGVGRPPRTSFPFEFLGIVTPGVLAWHYSAATVGLCLSLTNYSLIPQEMMACGLPCVDLAGRSMETVFGSDGPVELSEPDPLALADALETLLDDPARWRARSEAGLAFVEGATWERAARQVEKALRAALRERERTVASEPRRPD